MDYKIEEKIVEFTLTAADVDDKYTEENFYSYLPKEVQDWYYKNKDKKGFVATFINGRTKPYKERGAYFVDGITGIFEIRE